nr:diguanylate cyclase [Pirellula sp.]
MSWSRFITVENLCIAAEVTAALLLLAFSIPEKRAKAKSSADDEGNRALPELARRAFLEEKIAQSLSRLAMLESSRPAVDLAERFNSELSDAELLGWLDRLSGTYNRSFIDIFLKRWLALPSENRVGSFLSMVSLKDYTELVRDSGPVQVELMLREVGNRLKSQFAEHAIVARLPPDRFLILTFDADPSVGVKCLDFASGAAPDSNSAPETQSKPLELITSVVELADELPTFEDAVSQLETGIDAATQAGAKCFIKQGTQWSSDIPTPPASSRSSSSRTKVSSSPKSSAKPSTVAASAEDVALASSSKTSDPSVTEGSEPNQETAGKSNGGDELNQLESDLLDTSVQSKSADVSAVASNEEIAALFAQIKKNESKDGKLQDAKADDASTVSGDLKVDASSDTVSNKSETDSVSGDDIASLFAAAKASSKPKQESPAPKVTPETKGKSAASKEADDTVSADDIASLFAAAKPASKPKQESPEPKDTPGAKGKSAANKGDDDTVSA